MKFYDGVISKFSYSFFIFVLDQLKMENHTKIIICLRSLDIEPRKVLFDPVVVTMLLSYLKACMKSFRVFYVHPVQFLCNSPL